MLINAYFGNVEIHDLNPTTIYSIGNEYYSDGKTSYFCSAISEKNNELSTFMEVFQRIAYTFSKDKKPQSYIYPYKKLETSKPIKKLDNLISFATDGDKIYYEGKPLENADDKSLKKVSNIGEYFCDKTNVYYKNEILPIKNTRELEIVSISQGDYFLYDRKNGEVFSGTYRFNKNSAPYKVMGNNSSHAYNIIFVANDGIYFYNSKTNKQEKIGSNDFKGEIKNLNNNVFFDEENLYFLSSFEEFKRRKYRSKILYSRNTQVVYFDKKYGWEKIKDIGLHTICSVWTKEGKYYYFDDLGNNQLVKNTVFEINGKNVVNELLSNSNKISMDRIRDLINQKQMQVVDGKVQFKATVKYGMDYRIFLVLVSVVVIFIYLLKRRYKEWGTDYK